MPSADSLVKPGDFDRLKGILKRAWSRAIGRGMGLAGDSLSTPTSELYDRADPGIANILDEIGERIVDIENETRKRVARSVDRAVREGWSPGDLAKRLRSDPSGAFGKRRAMVIARTETANAYNRGSLHGYRRSGRVTKVRVHDNEGPNSCEACARANGEIWTLEKAEKNPTEHPNCVRSFSAIVAGINDEDRTANRPIPPNLGEGRPDLRGG